MRKKAFIAMSGGVDSSVAAFLLKEQGFDCTGVTMRLSGGSDGRDIGDAQSVACALGIPHEVFDLSTDFDSCVVSRFVEAYRSGATPNPCVECNRRIKFGKLLDLARERGADYLATGHYARVEFDGDAGRYVLRKALDGAKDQSYVLYSLTQEQLRHIILPLGAHTKSDIRVIAARQGFVSAGKSDSQDICFVPDGDYAGFIERYMGSGFESGDFIDLQGNILGRHRGQLRYTIGQRKGLGLALPRPMYVHSKDAARNTVTLCFDDELYRKTLTAADFNWIARDVGDAPVRCKAKVRYKQVEANAVAVLSACGTVKIEFDEPQRAIAKGQAVVLYDGDAVLGGGTIV